MKIRESILRLLIREALAEQVVGFNIGSGPAAAKYGSSSASGSDDDEDFLSVGTTSVPVDPGSEEETGSLDSDVQTLTQKRQQQLNKGDTVDARSTGRQLGAVTKKLG